MRHYEANERCHCRYELNWQCINNDDLHIVKRASERKMPHMCLIMKAV